MARRAFSYQQEDFEVRASTVPRCGKGLFSRVMLYPGDRVGPYLGKRISDIEAEQEPYISSHYLLWVCTDCTIVGENYTRYINHSDHPNVRFVVSTRWKKARIEVVDTIHPGEELFLDYGPHFWEASEEECIKAG